MHQNTYDDKSALVQVMAWCHQATYHCLSQVDLDLCNHMVSLGHKSWEVKIILRKSKWHICNILVQHRQKTFMVHQTFVWWALCILFKFVKSFVRHLGPAVENVWWVQTNVFHLHCWYDVSLLLVHSLFNMFCAARGIVGVQVTYLSCLLENNFDCSLGWLSISFYLVLLTLLWMTFIFLFQSD